MSSTRPRVLFMGDRWLGSNARSMANGFRAAGAEVIQVDTTRVSRPPRLSPSWTYLKMTRSRFPADRELVLRQMERYIRDHKPDILFGFKLIHLDQARILSTPVPVKVHYSADDVSNPANISDDYLRYEAKWDLIVTTKRHNIEEIQDRTGRAPLFVWSAYDAAWHHPVARTSSSAGRVSFIGNRRRDRVELIHALARKYGNRLRLAGPGWRSARELSGTKAVRRNGVYGQDFSEEVARASAHLVLLNSDNRDTHTCRSFEVPAAGGLFVGERTDEHEALIEDGVSGYLFDSLEELESILDRLAKSPTSAADIAWAGYRRVTSGKNDYRARATEILRHLGWRGGD